MAIARTKEHFPVMLEEVLEALNVKESGHYLDCTFGRGGYTQGILDLYERTIVTAFDRDISVLDKVRDIQARYDRRFVFNQARFSEMDTIFSRGEKFDGIVFDLGVSSPQLDRPERGFSFRFDGPLDMRMEPTGQTAADVVNFTEEEELANLIYKYGEERRSRVVAKAIVQDRKIKPFETTAELASLLRRVVPRSKDGIDPATRTFQALRIHVNDELGELERALLSCLSLLNDGGRLVVVSFHSLEDRIVKHFMQEHGKRVAVNKYARDVQENSSTLEILTRKAVFPSAKEVRENSRSRSAKLRAAAYRGGACAGEAQ